MAETRSPDPPSEGVSAIVLAITTDRSSFSLSSSDGVRTIATDP